MTNPSQHQQHSLRQASLETIRIIEDLPTLPDRFLQIQSVLDDADSSLQDLTDIIQTDQVTSATILKIANSSFYNPLGAPVSNLAYAISRLGRKETGDIALSISLLYGFAIPASIAMIRRFWAHAFAVGQISRYIASQQQETNINPDTLFMAALMHDIGRVVLAMRIDMSYFEKSFNNLGEQQLIAAEIKHYGIDHAEVGEIILRQWGLAPEVYEVVAQHHQSEHRCKATMICHFADTFATEHLDTILSIEDVQIQLQDGLFDQALEAFYTSTSGEVSCPT